MTLLEIELMRQLLDAHRILREAYHHDMHRETPAKSIIEERVETLLATYDRKSSGTDLPLFAN